jgi:hypothetical protein
MTKAFNVKQVDIWKTPFVVFQSNPEEYYSMVDEATKGIEVETILSRLFFHPKNMKLIQKMIKRAVFEASGKKYWLEDDQNDNDVFVVMRSMYLQHARHLDYDFDKQIMELNFYVVDDVVPGIISEIRAQEGYLQRAFDPRHIISHSINLSRAGSRTLPSITTLYTSNENYNYNDVRAINDI